ncbi:MAG: hypothetical protein AAF648_08840 [Pseudomonadota bacterium]
MSRFDLLIALTLVVILALVFAGAEDPTRSYSDAIDLALRKLDDSDLERRETRGFVRLEANNERHAAARIVRSLPASYRNRAVPLILNLGPVERALGLAHGVDRGYHVWQSFLERYVPFEVDNPWYPLLHLASRKSYLYDHQQYRIGTDEDLWQTSRQAFREPQGDCEDHAILLADWLIGIGERARVAVGTMRGEGHAWVVLFREGREYLLESTRKNGLTGLKRYPLAALHPEYHPQYQFDRDYFWIHTGSQPTVRYDGEHWQRQSRFERPAAR